MDWFENEALFFEQLEIGHSWSQYVAKILNQHDVPCHATQMEKRKNIYDRHRFQNEQDVVLHKVNGWLEVKANTHEFDWDPSSFPYSRPFVDTQAGWRRKNPKPLAVCLVSQQTGAIIVIPASTESSWRPVVKYDHVRKIEDTFLTVHRDQIRPFSDLVHYLKTRQAYRELNRPTSAQGWAEQA